jgi:hypothetical protein
MFVLVEVLSNGFLITAVGKAKRPPRDVAAFSR